MRALLDDAGLPLAGASYDAWGVPETAAIAPFGFTGELQRGNDVWLRARWYGAGLGAFGSRDPFAGWAETPYSLMPYQYSYSAPSMWTDASGACIPPLGYLRQLEPLNCSNLEAAARIWNHPKADGWVKGLALSYVTAWATGHVCALVGAGIIATETGTAIATGSAIARVHALAAAAPAVLRWLGVRTQQAQSVWHLPPLQRGVQIEQQLGHNVPPSYAVIDRWNAVTGEAASIKSIDLNAPTYLNSLTQLTQKVTAYITSMARYAGNTTSRQLPIQPWQIRSRVLDLAIPVQGGTAAQLAELQRLQQYAASIGITLNLHRIP